MEKPKMTNLKLAEITIGTSNPRKEFDAESINELAASIKEKGVLQPIIVRPHAHGKFAYQLVCGERRYRASVQAALVEIPAVIRELTDIEVMELQIIENLQRKDVHPMEEAVGFKQIIESKKYDVKEIALRVGKSAPYVAARIKLTDLIRELQKDFYKNRMSIKTAMILCKLRTEDQKDFYKREVDKNMDEITISAYTLKEYMGNLMDAPFDPTDATLKKEMGACGTCQFNSASNASLFPEDAKEAMCRNSSCFQSKADIFFARELEKALADPSTVLVSSEWNFDANDKTIKKVIAAGFTVYKSSDYNENKKPVLDKLQWYDDNDGDFDNQSAMDEAWEEEVADHKKQMEQYLKTITNGKFQKAFCVHGDDKGKYLYVKLTKTGKGGAAVPGGDEEKKKSPAAVVQDKIKEGKANKEEIQGEINRIMEVEKRKREIDEEKMSPLIYSVIEDDTKETFQLNKKTLSKNEKIAAIIILLDKTCSNEVKDHLKKLGIKYKGPEPQLYFFLKALGTVPIDELLNLSQRAFILDNINRNDTAKPSKHDDVKAWLEITRDYFPNEVKMIELDMNDEREKRNVKIQARIKTLKEELKGAPAGKAKKKK